MVNINDLKITAYLSRDAKKVKGGVGFSIAHNRSFKTEDKIIKSTDYFNCVIKSTNEEYVKKLIETYKCGTPVIIDGEVQTWKDNNDPDKLNTVIIVKNINKLDDKF